MTISTNPGRVAGLWYLILAVLGPVRLMYIPDKLFVKGDPAATVHNIATHEMLFRLGIVSALTCSVVVIFLVLAFYRLFKDVDQRLAVMVMIFGGVIPAAIGFVNVVSDSAALMIATGDDLMSVFSEPQRNALAVLFLRLGDHQNTAAEILWGVWLLPLAVLVYRSRFLPRFLAVWLVINGIAYIVISLLGELWPDYQGKMFNYSMPALFGELALVLWLVIRGSRTPGPGIDQSRAI